MPSATTTRAPVLNFDLSSCPGLTTALLLRKPTDPNPSQTAAGRGRRYEDEQEPREDDHGFLHCSLVTRHTMKRWVLVRRWSSMRAWSLAEIAFPSRRPDLYGATR